jgi:hypothetical protein
VTIAANCQLSTPQVAHVQARRIATFRVGISVPSVVIQTRSSRAGIQVRPFRSGFLSTLSSLTAYSRLPAYRAASSLSRTQFPVGRLHRYLKQWTQDNLRAGAKAAVYLGRGSEISLRGGPKISAWKGDHQKSCDTFARSFRKARGPFRRAV